MCLGGGTALAARWAHRHSTDVDLFTTEEAFQRLFDDQATFRGDLAQNVRGVVGAEIEEGFAKLLLAHEGGEVSLSSSKFRTDNPVSPDTVRGTSVPLETNAEILAKKVRYRMLRNALLVPRDLYDIAVSRHKDPGAFGSAVQRISVSQLEDIGGELRYLGRDWMARHHHQLIRPVYEDDAVNAVAIVRRQIQREIESRQPARYRPPPPWQR